MEKYKVHALLRAAGHYLGDGGQAAAFDLFSRRATTRAVKPVGIAFAVLLLDRMGAK
jgi:hypothetical protein